MPDRNIQGVFYRVGSTLDPSAPSYVERPADDELLRAILSGEYCNLFAARQMGKSSLVLHTAVRLAERGVRAAIIALSRMGVSITARQWYLGILRLIRQEMGLDVDEIAWWSAQSSLSPVQRFDRFVREQILDKTEVKIVIFVDEIDATLALRFTDDFFAAIRAMYNKRASDPNYRRLTFVLVGVARPTDLIKDSTKTPYNVGHSVNLDDFDTQSAQGLLLGLRDVYPGQAQDILDRVLHWTGGHPYLTQRVCGAIVESAANHWTDEGVDRLVEDLFFKEGQLRRETNLQRIDDYVRGNEYWAQMLQVYQDILNGQQVPDEERSIEKSRLKLSGLVKANAQGYLQVRNPIYEHVFGLRWLELTLGDSPAQAPPPRVRSEPEQPQGLLGRVKSWLGFGKRRRRS